MKGRRYKLWCSGKGDGAGGVGAMVKEELCEVMEVGMVSDEMMTAVLVSEERAKADLWVCSVKWKKFGRQN